MNRSETSLSKLKNLQGIIIKHFLKIQKNNEDGCSKIVKHTKSLITPCPLRKVEFHVYVTGPCRFAVERKSPPLSERSTIILPQTRTSASCYKGVVILLQSANNITQAE